VPDLPPALHVGLDVGGTFTDLVVLGDDGRVWSAKASTTPGELERGVQDALAAFADEHATTVEDVLSRVRSFGHGTTQATNVVVERTGARIALITTRGFRDTMAIARLQGFTAGVPDALLGVYSARRQPPALVDRQLVFEVPERVDQAGRVLLALDDSAAREAIEAAVAAGVTGLAVALLWSPANPVHERRIAELAAELAPALPVSLSHEIAPVVGEYERTAATLLNGYVAPRVRAYLELTERRLRERGLAGPFRVLSSAGGVMSAADAARRPVMLLGSGPAGGVIGSRELAGALGHRNVITADMGGTSFDVGLIVDGQAQMAAITEAGGLHAATPSIEITAIGAGGGSIAQVVAGTLQVGPASAGADPGPVCYGRGGELPTVTDADVVLGILDPDRFLGGRMALDREAAAAAIERRIAAPLGLSVAAAAAGIRRVVDAQMAGALREITIGRGHDPRDFVLYAYGGAGPMHCATFGAELGVPAIVIPATGMVHCAYGALASDVVHSVQAALSGGEASGLDEAELERRYATLEREAAAVVGAAGVAGDGITLRRSADLRYRAQTNQLIIDHDGSLDELLARFERTYEDHYGPGSAYREAGVEITTLRVQAIGATETPRRAGDSHPEPDRGTTASASAAATREITEPLTARPVTAAVRAWSSIVPGERLTGPAIVEHPTTTVYVAPGQRVAVDALGNLQLTLGQTA
jgi:N-methylhydantoinase A